MKTNHAVTCKTQKLKNVSTPVFLIVGVGGHFPDFGLISNLLQFISLYLAYYFVKMHPISFY